MAKDGSQRGGARVGAGKKRKALADKIADGQVDINDLPVNNDFENYDLPTPKDFLSATQKDGTKLYSKLIFKETWLWLKSHGCIDFVPLELIEKYAELSARFIFCDEKLSQYGMIGSHPTTGEPIASPYVRMSLDYMKQSSQTFYQIFQIVREHSVDNVGSNSNDVMESLLRRVK